MTAAVTAAQGELLDTMYRAWTSGRDGAETVNGGQVASGKAHHRVLAGLAERGLIRCVRSFPDGGALFGLTQAGREAARTRKWGA